MTDPACNLGELLVLWQTWSTACYRVLGRDGPPVADTLECDCVTVGNSIKCRLWWRFKVFLIRQWVSAGHPAGSAVQSHRHKHFHGRHIFPSVTHFRDRKQQSGLSHDSTQPSRLHPLVENEPFPIKKDEAQLSPLLSRWVKVLRLKITHCGNTKIAWPCFSVEFYKQPTEIQHVYVQSRP